MSAILNFLDIIYKSRNNLCKNNIISHTLDYFLPKSYLQEQISIVLTRAGIGSGPYQYQQVRRCAHIYDVSPLLV